MTATIGLYIGGRSSLSSTLYYLFRKYSGIDGVNDVLSGLRACSVGLIASSACTILLIALMGSAQPSTVSVSIC